ncbi:MAG: fumarate hydratase [Candidatus Omnitrophota bacterium]|nr:fumarate hydratase [Candidatus Omnitrophota bacterium]
MREVNVSKIKDTVRELCLKANFDLRKDVLKALKDSLRKEKDARARGILKSVIENAKLAKTKRIAICQDTGMAVVHMEIGQDVFLAGGDLKKAVDEGVRDAYSKGYLRKSVVGDPILRENAGTNTPSVLHTEIVEGDRIRISVSPKGFGSENKSRIMMFRPTDSVEDIKRFVVDVVKDAGPAACPPFVLGIGIGGTFEGAALLAKKALLRPIGEKNPARHIARIEKDLVNSINALGMGPMGLGGGTTVLGVNILEAPTHIAGLPVAVNVSCHATRSAGAVI